MKISLALRTKVSNASLWPADKKAPDFDQMIKTFEESFSASAATDNFKGKKIKVVTVNGDIIRGLVTGENSSSITVQTIAGDAVIRRSSIVKSEIE